MQLLRRGLKVSHIRLLAALAVRGQVAAAAGDVGISQPAASRLMAEVERITGQPMHVRTGRGIALTEAGAALARRAARVLIEIEDAERELAEIGGGTGGQVRLGAVTGAAMDRVLPALLHARDALPGVQIEVVVATSDVLCAQLLAGRLDFALGRLPRSGAQDRLRFRSLSGEPVSLLVRQGHPLPESPPVDELMRYDWVMPGEGAILRQAVHARLRALGLPEPPGTVSTASFLLTLALLQQSDAIAPLARAVAHRFGSGADAPFRALQVDLGIEVEPFGVVTRVGGALPPVAQRLLALVTGDLAAKTAVP
jgi:DNA-binding transcriptional LysR family regulator